MEPKNERSQLISTTGADSVEVPDIKDSEIEIISELGKGCFGTVYKGKCRGKVVAVKKLHKDMDDLKEFRDEIQILTHLRHPNVVLFMGACTEPGKLAIVTEFLPLGDVHAVIHNKNYGLSQLKMLSMARDVAMGMNWLHCSKPSIIHRDLKPTNLLVDDNWNVKICDFGLSAWQLNKTLQDSGVAPGTPLWMSPEVLRGRPLTEKVDIYSFGIVLWEMLTGREPFEEHDDYDRFVEAVCDNHERPDIPDTMHASLSSLLSECWHAKPNKRPSFSQIIPLLESAMVDTSVIDTKVAELWKSKYSGQLQTTWTLFSIDYYKLLEVPLPRDRDVTYLCLQSLLCPTSMMEVTLERLGLYSKWFAPVGDSEVLNRLTSTLGLPYFHGDISRKDCESFLSTFRKGSFLVRLSMTEPVQLSPFTISKVNSKGEVNHQRVYVMGADNENTSQPPTSAKEGFYVHVKDKKNKNKMINVEAEGPLLNLFKNKRTLKELGLSTPCPGSKYAHLFEKKRTQESNPYIGEDQ